MTDAEWNRQQKQEAIAECAKCPGRQIDACSWQCRYWKWTATAEEREAVAESKKPKPKHKKIMTTRGWNGGVQPAGFRVDENSA
jgi:hypothetical protein